MIRKAKAFDSRPDYRLMELALPKLEPVDFLVSMYVLQHLVEWQAADYLDKFPSLLTEGGIGVVQASTPSEDGGISDPVVREVLGDRLFHVHEQGGWATSPVAVSRTYWFTS